MRSLADFRDLHSVETILVCGCGASLNQLRDPERFVTIGVNDVGRKFHPDYLVVVNPRNQFSGDRFRYVENSRAKFIFTQLDLGLANSNIVKFRLGRRGGTEVEAGTLAVPYTNISPYVALCLARFMGARRIGVIGVDFTDDHFFGPTGRHPLFHSLRRIDAELHTLAAAFAQDGIELWNLSATSALTAFPKASVEQFLIGPMPARGSRSAPSPLRIVSYAKTPVAGVPPILARCINAQTAHRCECVWQRASYGNGVSFSGGTEWSRDPRKAEELLAAADVVIVHNGHVASQHRQILDAKPVVTMAHNYAWNVDFRFVERGYPGVVVGQYPATLPAFASWHVVPNPIPLWEPEFQPEPKPDRFTIAYTPSGKHERYPPDHRLFWHSKGYDSTVRILDTLARRFPLRLEVTRHGQVPQSEALAMKRRAHVVIDECVTGSYHRNSLEGLAAGCIVFNGMHLRPAVMEAFAQCSGTGVSDSPFDFADLESLQDRLVALIECPLAEVVATGRGNREWMEAHWNFAQQWDRFWLSAITAAREKRSSHRSVAPQPSHQRPMIRDFRSCLSVVVPHGGHDRLPLLAYTLEHLRRQEEVGEIVVVEMGARPSAVSLVKPGNEKYQFIEDAGVFHKARVMNAGLALASRDLLFWIDNDLIVPAGFLSRAIAEKKRRGLHCLIPYTNVHFLSEADSRAVLAGRLSPSQAVPVSCNSTRRGCRGGAVLADREWVGSCGGMREEFRGWGGEDDAWYYFCSHFGKVAVTDQPDQDLFHLYHRLSGGYGSDEHFATNPCYAQNVALLRKLMRLRTRSEVLEQFPISLLHEGPCPSVIEA